MTKRKTILRLVSMLTAVVLCSVVVPYAPKQADVIATGVVDGANAGITTASSSQAENLANVALGEEGYTEGSNNNNKYGSYYNNNNAPWCAYFISWCARKAGIPTSVIKNNANAELFTNSTTGRFGGKFYLKGNITPQVGDIVYYDWNKNGSSDHVEIVVSVNTSAKTFTSIGGNTKGDSGSTEGVRRHSNYSFTRSDVFGFERPNYSNVPPTPSWKFDVNNAPKCSSTRWIGSGSVTSGNDVRWVQYALNLTNNAGLTVDGIWGSASTSATKTFQKKYGLTQDGQAGIATINKLVEIIKGNTKLSTPKVSVNKSTATTDDTINISCNAVNNATWYWMSLYKDDKLYINQALDNSLSFSKKLPVGSYKADISAHNDYSDSESGSVSFTVVLTGNEMSKGAGQTIADGDYWIESALSKRYLVDIAGDNYDTANGTNLKMHIWNSDTFGKYDAFTFKYLNNGFYQITQRTTNMAIDVNGASKERGANVQMWKSSNSTAQQWSITKTSDGYKLQAKCSGFCLDVYGGKVENNSNLNVWEDNGTKAQRFNLIPYKCSHTFGSWSTVQNATCTADGKQTRKCTDCGYTESKTIAKTGHSLSNWTTSKNATCTADGTQIRKCSKCSYTEEKTIAKTGHSLGNWTTSKNATCTADGTQVRKCNNCGYSEEKAIVKTGHKYTDSIVAPSCTEKGYTLHTCSSCNDSYKDKETNAKGHTFTSNMIGGYMTYVCSDCGYMYTAPFEGEGTEKSPFIISNADELKVVSETVNNTEINQIFGHAYYKQTADIDLENISWTPIGLGYDGEDGRGAYNYNTRMFFGVYDGNQHTIYNLNVDKNWIMSGLFGDLRSSKAKVCSLVVYGNIGAGESCGGIAGETNYYSIIENCAFIGDVKGTKNVGGIAGWVYDSGTIRNCYHNGTVTGGEDVGSIAGAVSFNKFNNDDDATLIENCYHVNGEVTGETCGAIVGDCVYFDGKNNTITIKNCYASKCSTYSGKNEEATYDDTMILPDSMLKKIAEDLGEAYADNTNSELNNGFPVFPWQLKIMLKGDADNNGVVDVNDAIMLQEWLLGASEELTNWENVDLCEDGRIDVFDLCLLRKILAE